MQYEDSYKELTIDLSEDKLDGKVLLDYPEVSTVKIENYHGEEFPKELNELKNIAHLSLRGKDKKIAFPIHPSIQKLTSFKELRIWSTPDLDTLVTLLNVTNLTIITGNVTHHIKKMVTLFPNLTVLDIWESPSEKPKEIPDEIGDLKNLIELSFTNCTSKTLPEGLNRLTHLEKLTINGFASMEFPVAVCKLTWLKELHYKSEVVTLPDELSQLTSLRVLNLSYALNKGTSSPVTNEWSDEKVYLHPIPLVINKLSHLKELVLDNCGVIDTKFLTELNELETLSLANCGLTNCEGLSHLTKLKTLSLTGAEELKSLNGLSGLAIESLNLRSCEIKSIDEISHLSSLKELNIEYCNDIENISPLLAHPTLEKLKANGSVLEKWKKKEELALLTPLNTVLGNISTEDTKVFQEAIESLWKHVEKDFNEENSPLASYFNEEPNEENIVSIPVLEKGLEKHRSTIHSKTLVYLVNMSLLTLSEDNYYITLLAIQEIIRRKDIEAQNEVVETFKKASEYYEEGHRFWESTVHDQLLDSYFEQFEFSPLHSLLKHAGIDFFSLDGGTELLPPLFSKVKSEEEFSQAFETYFNYREEHAEYIDDPSYFDDLHQQIVANTLTKYHKQLKAKEKELKDKTKILQLFQSQEEQDLISLLEVLKNAEEGTLAYKKKYLAVNTIQNNPFAQKYLDKIMDCYRSSLSNYLGGAAKLLYTYNSDDGFKAIITILNKHTETHPEFTQELAKEIIFILNEENEDFEIVKEIRSILRQVSKIENDDLFIPEIKQLFLKVDRDGYRLSDEEMENLITRIEDIGKEVKSTIDLKSMDFDFKIHLMAEYAREKEWQNIKRLFLSLLPIMPEEQQVSRLHIAIISAVMTKDKIAFDKFTPYASPDTKDNLLAYNLACAYAFFEDKDAMILWIKHSLKLGKTKEQFKDDKDFEKYYQDPDFLSLMNND